MSILSLLIVFVIVGVALYLINTYVPMEGRVKQLMNAAVIIILVLWLLNALFPGLTGLRIEPVN